MSTMRSVLESLGFTSENLRPADRIPLYREVASPMLGTVDIEPIRDSFSCNGRFLQLPDLGISHVMSSRRQFGMTPSDVRTTTRNGMM